MITGSIDGEVRRIFSAQILEFSGISHISQDALLGMSAYESGFTTQCLVSGTAVSVRKIAKSVVCNTAVKQYLRFMTDPSSCYVYGVQYPINLEKFAKWSDLNAGARSERK